MVKSTIILKSRVDIHVQIVTLHVHVYNMMLRFFQLIQMKQAKILRNPVCVALIFFTHMHFCHSWFHIPITHLTTCLYYKCCRDVSHLFGSRCGGHFIHQPNILCTCNKWINERVYWPWKSHPPVKVELRKILTTLFMGGGMWLMRPIKTYNGSSFGCGTHSPSSSNGTFWKILEGISNSSSEKIKQTRQVTKTCWCTPTPENLISYIVGAHCQSCSQLRGLFRIIQSTLQEM